MLDEFISKRISSKFVIIKSNNSKRKGYGANWVENNKENDIHHTIRSASINESEILSGCISINVHKSRQNLYLRLISAIYNLSDNNTIKVLNSKPKLIISYNLYNNKKLLNY